MCLNFEGFLLVLIWPWQDALDAKTCDRVVQIIVGGKDSFGTTLDLDTWCDVSAQGGQGRVGREQQKNLLQKEMLDMSLERFMEEKEFHEIMPMLRLVTALEPHMHLLHDELRTAVEPFVGCVLCRCTCVHCVFPSFPDGVSV